MPKKAKDAPFPFNKTELLAILDFIGGDGHGIFDFEGMVKETKIESARLALYVRDHVSGNGPKETIFTDKGIAEHLVGIYGLDMLNKLYDQAKLNPHVSFPNGRGFRARFIDRTLRQFAETLT